MNLATSLPTPDLTAERQRQLATHFQQRLIELPHAVQAVREAGSGPAVVLLHGIGSGAASWLQVATELARHCRVIAWDAPGYGDSTPLPQAQPCAEDYAERLGQLLDALAVERCVLVGHSLGAITATAFARACPQRVARLVLVSPARGYGAADRSVQRQQVRQRRLANLDQLGIARMASERSPHMLSQRAKQQDLAWVQWNMARLNDHGYRQAIELLCGDDLLRHTPLAVPTEVHCGEADSITPPDSCLSLARALEVEFNLIPDAGHASPIEQPLVLAGRLAWAVTQSLTGSAQ